MNTEVQAIEIMGTYVGSIVARSILQGAAAASNVDPAAASPKQLDRLLHAMESGIRVFSTDEATAEECCTRLREVLSKSPDASSAGGAHLCVDITAEYDVVIVRGHAKAMASDIGFTSIEQVKIATAASELARNIVQYAGTGAIELRHIDSPRNGIEISACDRGPGIPDVELVLSGEYQSKTGMGMGLLGVRRLMDDFAVDSAPSMGTQVTARKYL